MNLNFGFELKSIDIRNSKENGYAIYPQIHYNYIFSENNQSINAGLRGGLNKNSLLDIE